MLRISSCMTLGALLALSLAGCRVGPEYKPDLCAEYLPRWRRNLPVAMSFGTRNGGRVSVPNCKNTDSHSSLQNYDVRIAATRVLEAQGAGGDRTGERISFEPL